MNRAHRRKRLARKFLADPVLERQLACFAIEEKGLARLNVAMRIDQPDIFVGRFRNNGDLFARILLFQPVEVGFVALVFEIMPRSVVHISGAHQFVGRFGENSVLQIHPFQRIGFNGLDLAAHRVEKRQRHFIYAVAFVGLQVDSHAVFVKP